MQIFDRSFDSFYAFTPWSVRDDTIKSPYAGGLRLDELSMVTFDTREGDLQLMSVCC